MEKEKQWFTDFKARIKRCPDCGENFEAEQPTQKYCEPCANSDLEENSDG